ncbi:MAG: diguanylate cyclase [Acidobacteria bacterium]|nr:diguanylate cyclase [Acidobacteriota bacterium]MCI0720509.1 diguanylate cyclase [Acidobacteriota bacterium]
MTQTKLNRTAPAESPQFRQLRQAFEELAELVGLTLVVYDKDRYLLGDCRPNAICSAVQKGEEGRRLCERDCGGMLDQVSRGGEFVSFKCHASLYSFAAPVRVEGQVRFVVLGGRVFRNYQDFSAFTKVAPQFAIKDYFFEDCDDSLRFENAEYFERTARFIQSMVDSFFKGSIQGDKAKKRTDQISTLYDLSSVLPLEATPEKIFHLVLQAIGVLFDIEGGAVLQTGGEGESFQELCSYGSLLARKQEIRLPEHAGFGELNQGEPLFIGETYPILRLGYPESVHSVQSLPVLHRNRLAWVVQVYNTPLDAESVELLQAYCRHLAVILENVLMKQEAQDNQSVLSVVTDFSLAIGAQLESQGLYRAILMKTAELAGAEQASLMIFDETSQELSIKCVKGLNEKIVQNLRVKPGQGVAGLVFDSGRPLLVKNVDHDPRFTERQRARYRTKSLLCVPLRINQRKIGVINLTDKPGEGFDENDLRLVESVASHASVALDRTDYYKMSEELRKISITDSLTDLYNRRFFQDRMSEEIERSRRHGQPVSLIMLDIDNFKHYNDTYGHLAGDEALRLTAAIIKNSVRNIDRVARYGGEEFAVILPMTEIAAARDIAERIRSGVAGRYFPDEALRAAVKLTASLGIASFPQHAGNLFELVGNADKALYLAKVSGKNCVAVFDKSRANKNAGGQS